MKKWWSDYANADGCNTIAELKDFEGAGHRMKGGHRHNHVYNKCHKYVFRGKNARKIDRNDKKEFVRIFYIGLKLNRNFGEFLHKIFHKNNNSTAQRAKDDKMKPMIETKHDLLTTKYTRVLEEKDFQFNAPHYFEVVRKRDENTEFDPVDLLAQVHFQEGPIKENGVNGVANEDLLVMVIRRLQGFQESEYKCRENAMAITKLEEALLWLRKRTMGRENRGVEGTHTV